MTAKPLVLSRLFVLWWSIISGTMFIVGLLLAIDYRTKLPVGIVIDSGVLLENWAHYQEGSTLEVKRPFVKVLLPNGRVAEINDISFTLQEQCRIGQKFPPFDTNELEKWQ